LKSAGGKRTLAGRAVEQGLDKYAKKILGGDCVDLGKVTLDNPTGMRKEMKAGYFFR